MACMVGFGEWLRCSPEIASLHVDKTWRIKLWNKHGKGTRTNAREHHVLQWKMLRILLRENHPLAGSALWLVKTRQTKGGTISTTMNTLGLRRVVSGDTDPFR